VFLETTIAVCSQLNVCLRRLPVQLVFNECADAIDPAAVSRLQSLAPELLLVEQPADRAAIPSLIERLTAELPGSSIILVNGSADSEAILEAIRAGARDYLYPPFDQALSNAVLRLEGTPSKTSAGVCACTEQGRRLPVGQGWLRGYDGRDARGGKPGS